MGSANSGIEQVRATGASQQVIDAKLQEMKNFTALYNNPLINAAITFTEPFPIGLIVTLISAGILRTRSRRSKRTAEAGELLHSAQAQDGK